MFRILKNFRAMGANSFQLLRELILLILFKSYRKEWEGGINVENCKNR